MKRHREQRTVINETNQNCWIPLKHLHPDGTMGLTETKRLVRGPVGPLKDFPPLRGLCFVRVIPEQGTLPGKEVEADGIPPAATLPPKTH